MQQIRGLIMNIICIEGYQYFDLGDDKFALVMDENGNALEEDRSVARWVRTSYTECSYVPGDIGLMN